MTFEKSSVQLCSMSEKEKTMKLSEEMKDKLGDLQEWIKYYAPLIAMFVFFYQESSAIRVRLDTTISNFQRSIDEVHKRCDVLHQEFIDLLKERRKED